MQSLSVAVESLGGCYRSLRLAWDLALHCLHWVAGLLASVTPLVGGLRRPANFAARLVSGAVETVLFSGSVLLLSGRLLLLRKQLTTNGKLAVGMLSTYFLKPTIALVIDYSKMNYRITRQIRKAGRKAAYFLQMLLVLPLSFLQMFDLFTLTFDTFRATFGVFFKVIEIGFSYAIFIFRTYRTCVLCSTAIMQSMYITAYYSILLVHSGLACLTAFTTLLQHSAVRQALISYKEHKRRHARGSAQIQ